MAVPGETLIVTLREVADAGVGCCVIISNGFAETGDEEGVRRQEDLIRISHETGMRIVGPNCMGLIVPHHNMALCSSVVLDTDTLGDGSIGRDIAMVFHRGSPGCDPEPWPVAPDVHQGPCSRPFSLAARMHFRAALPVRAGSMCHLPDTAR